LEGYEVVTNDGRKAGRVVRVDEDVLVVEHGTLRKHRNALPREFAHVDDDEKVVRATVSKELLEEAPEVNGEVDQRAIAAYYGFAGGFEAPSTEGYGDTLPDDPGRSSEEQAGRAGVTTGPEERIHVREGEAPADEPSLRQIHPDYRNR
jgi:hypothetical protein